VLSSSSAFQKGLENEFRLRFVFLRSVGGTSTFTFVLICGMEDLDCGFEWIEDAWRKARKAHVKEEKWPNY
jgi:hypothetical protein